METSDSWRGNGGSLKPFGGKKRRSESGAQLLARLTPRPTLQAIDSMFEWPTAGAPRQGGHRGQGGRAAGGLVELYGREGGGKSCLALHWAARAALPPAAHGVSLGGAGAKVLFVDTDYKFSVFTLAVFLERLVVTGVEQHNKKVLDDDDKDDILQPCSKKQCVSSVGCSSEKGVKKSFSDVKRKTVQLSDSEVETVVEESLARIKIARVAGSSQLLITLISFENIVITDSDVSLIVIDSISAFYWEDRGPKLEEKMKRVIHALEKLTDQSVSVVMTKSALLSSRKGGVESHFKSSNKDNTDCLEHVEFLGRNWSDLNIRRIILSKEQNPNGLVSFCASSPHWESDRKFSFVNDSLTFSN